MNKTKRIISVICALAMMFSMFSMLTVNAADSDVKFTMEITDGADAASIGDQVTVEVGYEGLDAALINAIQFQLAVPEGMSVVSATNAAANMWVANVGSVNATDAAVAFAFLATSDALRSDATSDKLATIVFELTDAVEDLELVISNALIENNTAEGVKTIYATSDVPTKDVEIVNESVVINSTASDDDTEPTPEPSEPTPTPMPEEDWTLVTKVKTTDDLAVGAKYEISTEVADGKTFDGTFDIVVAVYNAEGVAVGFVVYNDVAIGEVNTFYTSQDNTISVNTISDIDEDSSALFNEADMLAAKK